MSNIYDRDQTPHFVEPNLGTYCLQKSSIGVAPITHVRNKNSTIQGRSLKGDHYYKELLIKERIGSL